MSTIKSWWLVLAFLSGFALAMAAEELILNWRDDRLEFSAPRVHFLRRKTAGAAANAAPVPFDFQVTLWSGTRDHVFQRITDRFVVSYDLWEENFKVVKTAIAARERRPSDRRRGRSVVLRADVAGMT